VTATTTTAANDIARGVVESFAHGKLVLTVPGTKYKIHLVADEHADRLKESVGKRIKGRIHANALRLFKTSGGGGQFIEPIWGEPRIVAGLVEKVDQANRRILVNVVVPMWLMLEKGQPADMFAEGDMVNCYVQSGATLTPVSS
jgi:hypothetical protein